MGIPEKAINEQADELELAEAPLTESELVPPTDCQPVAEDKPAEPTDPLKAAQLAETLRARQRTRQLFERKEQGDPQAREQIIIEYMSLAHKLAAKYAGTEQLEDLKQVACIGLIKAVEGFDASRGVSFTTFAFPTISGEIKRHIRDHSWATHVPRGLKEQALRVQKAKYELEQKRED